MSKNFEGLRKVKEGMEDARERGRCIAGLDAKTGDEEGVTVISSASFQCRHSNVLEASNM